MGRGLGVSEIAAQMFMSPSTVKRQINRVLGVLGANSKAQALVIAAKQGLI